MFCLKTISPLINFLAKIFDCNESIRHILAECGLMSIADSVIYTNLLHNQTERTISVYDSISNTINGPSIDN